MGERIVFKTKDGVGIVGTWVVPAAASVSVLLLHMWPADRTSWTGLQSLLAERNMASLAIDLRGHGESSGSVDNDASAMHLDVDAALDWMMGREVMPHGIVGASIGANLAIQAMARRPDLIAGVLLSPGIEFHRITTLDAAARLTELQSLYVVASKGDDQESADASQAIIDAATTKDKSIELLANAGHGTQMFDRHTDLPVSIANWLNDIVTDL
jgi:pimeloyl-ACP methyl ester carboxylesterase